jgi:hypothetical protein
MMGLGVSMQATLEGKGPDQVAEEVGQAAGDHHDGNNDVAAQVTEGMKNMWL